MSTARESVFFYTFHKCASTLFSSYVLPNVAGLRHVDYNAQAAAGTLAHEPTVEAQGFVYGPIRLSTRGDLPNYEAFRRRVGEPAFVRDRIAVCLVRDPRDLVISAYYSFGFSHVLSGIPEVRARQEARRARISAQTIDEFALEDAPRWTKAFDAMSVVLDACPRSVLLRYEDMVGAWPVFERDLTKYLSFSPSALREIYDRSRPRAKEDAGAHKRSGKSGGFRDKLRPETVAELDRVFAPILARYRFDQPVPEVELREPPVPLALRMRRLARALVRR
jgi:hypothetical protein